MDYRYALVPDGAPQSIPQGFDGFYDWPAIDDAEKARRGWVRDAAPPIDPAFERIAVTFAQGEDGTWVATYAVEPGDIELARAKAAKQIEDRRYEEQVKGAPVTIAGETYRFHTDTEGRSNLANAVVLGQAYEAQAKGNVFQTPWKTLDGYVTLKLPDLVKAGLAAGAYVTACFTREATILATLDAKRKTETLRAALAAEIDQGWPA